MTPKTNTYDMLLCLLAASCSHVVKVTKGGGLRGFGSNSVRHKYLNCESALSGFGGEE